MKCCSQKLYNVEPQTSLPLSPPPTPCLFCPLLFTPFFYVFSLVSFSQVLFIFFCVKFSYPSSSLPLPLPPPFHPLFHGFVTGEEGETGRRRKDSDFVSFFSLLFSFFFSLGFCWILLGFPPGGRSGQLQRRWEASLWAQPMG